MVEHLVLKVAIKSSWMHKPNQHLHKSKQPMFIIYQQIKQMLKSSYMHVSGVCVGGCVGVNERKRESERGGGFLNHFSPSFFEIWLLHLLIWLDWLCGEDLPIFMSPPVQITGACQCAFCFFKDLFMGAREVAQLNC